MTPRLDPNVFRLTAEEHARGLRVHGDTLVVRPSRATRTYALWVLLVSALASVAFALSGAGTAVGTVFGVLVTWHVTNAALLLRSLVRATPASIEIRNRFSRRIVPISDIRGISQTHRNGFRWHQTTLGQLSVGTVSTQQTTYICDALIGPAIQPNQLIVPYSSLASGALRRWVNAQEAPQR